MFTFRSYVAKFSNQLYSYAIMYNFQASQELKSMPKTSLQINTFCQFHNHIMTNYIFYLFYIYFHVIYIYIYIYIYMLEIHFYCLSYIFLQLHADKYIYPSKTDCYYIVNLGNLGRVFTMPWRNIYKLYIIVVYMLSNNAINMTKE